MSIPYAPTSWNPVVGCTPVSEGCKNCWAMKLHSQRHEANTKQAKIFSGLAEPLGKRRLRSYEGWKEWVTRVGAPPGGWVPRARQLEVRLPMPPQYDLPFNKIQLLPDRLSQPLRWRKPRTVAVCFMGDLFHKQVPDVFIRRAFNTMALSPQHTFLLLTKRPERMRAWFHDAVTLELVQALSAVWAEDGQEFPWPLPNVWLGVTAENQRMADKRIPLLLTTPAAHRWASVEPALEPINLYDGLSGVQAHAEPEWESDIVDFDGPRLDWVVVGGESGPGHRPMELGWARSIVAQCFDAHVPYFGKQASGVRPNAPLPASIARREVPWQR